MCFAWKRFGARLQASAALVSFILLIAGRTIAYPPPLELDDDAVHEAEAHVISSPKAVSYTVLLPHVPFTVAAEDFSARVIGNKVLKINMSGTPIDWHFHLVEAVPAGIKLIPPIEVERLPGDHTGAVWRGTVVIPKNIQALQAGRSPPPRGETAAAAGEAVGGAMPSLYPTGTRGRSPGLFGGAAAAYPWVTGPLVARGPTEIYPRHRGKSLPSASVLESMPLPSYDN